MRSFLLSLLLLVFSLPLSAKDTTPAIAHLEKYGVPPGSGMHSKEDDGKQSGDKMPRWTLSKEYSDKTTHGRYVIMNMWATWCGGCRLLSLDFDSLLVKNSSDYQDVVLLGVNAHETMVDKGFGGESWWNKQGIGFPSVGGKAADKVCDDLKGGHPSCFLIDSEGTILGRWDAWTPSTAASLRFLLWYDKLYSAEAYPATLETVQKLFGQQYYLEALYLLDQMEENYDTALLRFKTLCQTHIYDAVKYADDVMTRLDVKRTPMPTEKEKFEEWYMNQKDAPREYYDMCGEIASYIWEQKSTNAELARIGWRAARRKSNSYFHDDESTDLRIQLEWLYGYLLQQEALEDMYQYRQIARQNEEPKRIEATTKMHEYYEGITPTIDWLQKTKSEIMREQERKGLIKH